MTTSFKIRLLFSLLTVSFIITALSLRFSFHVEEILERDASQLETALHDQERFVTAFMNDPETFNKFRNAHRDSSFALELLEWRRKRSIYFYTYYDHRLTFWGANRITPESDEGLKEGSNILRPENGWYEAIKKTEGNFSLVCYIPIKACPIPNVAAARHTASRCWRT